MFDCVFVVISHKNFVNVTKFVALQCVEHALASTHTHNELVYNEQWAEVRADFANAHKCHKPRLSA